MRFASQKFSIINAHQITVIIPSLNRNQEMRFRFIHATKKW